MRQSCTCEVLAQASPPCGHSDTLSVVFRCYLHLWLPPLPRSRGGVRGEARSLGLFVCLCGWSRIEAGCLPELKLLVRFLLVVCTTSSADKAGWCYQS